MFNVCYRCSAYRVDKTISSDGRHAICPKCGHAHPFLRQPLLLVGGASGTGKSAICKALTHAVDQAVILEADILWRPEFNTPQDRYRDFMEQWLRLCKNIGQAGKPVVLLGAGTGVPENLTPCIEARYFSRLCFGALVCDDDVLAQRLRERPAWRQAGSEAFIGQQIAFNAWCKDQAQARPHPFALFDTTLATVEETARQVQNWIARELAAE